MTGEAEGRGRGADADASPRMPRWVFYPLLIMVVLIVVAITTALVNDEEHGPGHGASGSPAPAILLA